ncbi:MAG TPA: hypothetical protein PLU30_25225 [Verrucomicrobiae bacterium]|nr:hypothetical protein [Verrucomicrobiae bacterium]
MRRGRAAFGVRAEGDITDAGAWLQLYGKALEGRAGHRRAVALADHGTRQFSRRFRVVGENDKQAKLAAVKREQGMRDERERQDKRRKAGGNS